MTVVGHVESLWRYPVKSMRGEKLDDAFVGFSGVYGDRLYAVRNPAASAGFPYLTGRELAAMLLHRPVFRHPEAARQPPNLAAAEALGPGVTPVYAGPDDLVVDVHTPEGEVLAIDDPVLCERLRAASSVPQPLALLRSDRAMTDCRPVSLISLQTVAALGAEIGTALDARRFRANMCADLGASAGFTEDGFVGRSLRIGAKAVIALVDRDPRCKMITLDPDTGQANPAILRRVAQGHDGKAGVYGAVLVEGTVRPGDAITLLP